MADFTRFSVWTIYANKPRLYKDIKEICQHYPSLGPQQDNFVHNINQKEMLLSVNGTIPTTFKSQVYQTPILIWFFRKYPDTPPRLYLLVPPGFRLNREHPCIHSSGSGEILHD